MLLREPAAAGGGSQRGHVAMGFLHNPSIRLAIVAGVSIAGAFAEARAGSIVTGDTAGSTAMANPLPGLPLNRDDVDVTKSDNIVELSSSFIITQSAMAFPTYNFVFAGLGPIGEQFPDLADNSIEISTYQPWVVNSPNLVSNGGTTYNRGVTNQDAGGLNILIDYIPTGSDPTSVNFLQAFSVTTPALNGGMPIIAMDNGGKGGPYYNENGASGTDSNDTNTVPLDASTVEAWMLDIPYVCESGFSGTGMGCPAPTAANEETITSYDDTFDTFIEAPGTYMGTTYEVLYGGFRWGFTFTATDVPEPSTWAMMLLGFAGLAYAGYRKGKSARTAFA
jgi:hypothetical protein